MSTLTIHLDDLLKKKLESVSAAHHVGEQEWVRRVLIERLSELEESDRPARFSDFLAIGFDLGGQPLTRDEIYEGR